MLCSRLEVPLGPRQTSGVDPCVLDLEERPCITSGANAQILSWYSTLEPLLKDELHESPRNPRRMVTTHDGESPCHFLVCERNRPKLRPELCEGPPLESHSRPGCDRFGSRQDFVHLKGHLTLHLGTGEDTVKSLKSNLGLRCVYELLSK